MIQRTLLLLSIIVRPLGPVFADDWPQWRGPDRMDVSKETGLLQSWPAGGPKLLWTFRHAGPGYSCLCVVGDRLYSMGGEGDKDCVFALDLKTQKKLWSTAVGPLLRDNWSYGPRGTPTIDGNYLYALGGYGNLVCVETASGRKVWSQNLLKDLGGMVRSWGYTESPLVDGDQVVATPGGKQGTIAAFDKKTGKLKWRCTTLTDQAAYSSMIAIEAGGVRQYVQITDDRLVGVRASNGKLLWQVPFSSLASPVHQNDRVYVSNQNSCRLLQIIPEGDNFNAEQIYANREMQSGCGGFVRVGAYLYGHTRDGWLCQEFKTGRRVWKKNPGPGMGGSSFTFADGHLYCYHEQLGDVLLLKASPAGYEEKGRFRIPEESKLPLTCKDEEHHYTRPVVANGKLYLRDRDLIFCYDVRKSQ